MNFHTRILMTGSAVFMALLGLLANFLPQEGLGYAGISATGAQVLIVQVAGALYLGFALLNWAARGVLIGGIYARPVAMGNFVHFAVVAVTLVKVVSADAPALLLAATGLYVLFATWFGFVLFRAPFRN